jgi:hypothetical protein
MATPNSDFPLGEDLGPHKRKLATVLTDPNNIESVKAAKRIKKVLGPSVGEDQPTASSSTSQPARRSRSVEIDEVEDEDANPPVRPP